MACEAKRYSIRSRTSAKYRRAGVRREFDESIALPNGRDAPHDLGVPSCAGR
jgi:hypothetical protein